MKIVSIDIETTGIDRDWCQILEIGAVILDTSIKDPMNNAPMFKCIIDNGSKIQGEPFAIDMNARIFKILAGVEKLKNKEEKEAYRKEHNILYPALVAQALWEWLYINGIHDMTAEDIMNSHVKNVGGRMIPCDNKVKQTTINAGGKNFGTFDLQFLEKLPNWNRYIKVRSRIIDPAILFFEEDDKALPGLQYCLDRANIESLVTHDALEDAIDTAYVIYFGMKKCGLIKV